MRESTPSRTAQWVALARGLASRLPPEAQLAIDPYGATFEQGPRPRLHRALARAGIEVERFAAIKVWILYMQVRTRVIDDAIHAFVARGGKQLVLLGAGYDTRVLRLPALAGVRVFEIDHPATQRHKREVLERIEVQSPATYIEWNFEERPLSELPARLAEAGHDAHAPTFTIWEGVTMYLTEDAIDASLRAIRAWSAAGSELAITYFTRARLERPSLPARVVAAVVARVGEPLRWGWEPAELPGYLADRGFTVVEDVTMAEAARELLPPAFAALISGHDQRIALAGVRA